MALLYFLQIIQFSYFTPTCSLVVMYSSLSCDKIYFLQKGKYILQLCSQSSIPWECVQCFYLPI